jgi:hypothetical protein
MGYFDGLTAAAFKKDRSGNTVFYPWGVFGRGRILPDEQKVAEVRLFLRRYYQAIFLLIIPAAIAAQIKSVEPIVRMALMLACGIGFLGWFLIKVRSLTAGTEFSDESLSFRESYTNSAGGHNRATLWVLFGLSWLFVGTGIWMVLRNQSQRDVYLGAAAAVLFSLCACAIGYMAVVKGSPPR